MHDPFWTAIHEAGHASAALLRGFPVLRVGLTPEAPGQAGVCLFRDAEVGTVASLVDMAVVAAAGPVAELLAGAAPGAAITRGGDLDRIGLCRQKAARLAPPGWRFPDVHALARADLADPVTWAGVVTLARRIVERGGTLSGAEATAAVRTGWRDAGLVQRVQCYGHAAVR